MSSTPMRCSPPAIAILLNLDDQLKPVLMQLGETIGFLAAYEPRR